MGTQARPAAVVRRGGSSTVVNGVTPAATSTVSTRTGDGQVTITYDPTTDRCSGLGEGPGGRAPGPPAGVTPVPIAVAPASIIGTPKFTG